MHNIFFTTFISGMLQGFTEFLPISSDAHLILLNKLLAIPDQINIDIAGHFGTLLAVIVYFMTDLKKMAVSLIFFRKDKYSFLFLNLILATIPIVILGFLLKDFAVNYLHGSLIIMLAIVVFAIFLYYADRKIGLKSMFKLSNKHALIIGLFQCLAIIPGTSRSGITISGALLLGYNRRDAARFSMLLSIPTIIGASVLALFDMINKSSPIFSWQMIEMITVSFFFAIISIKFMLWLISKLGYTPFVVYRIFLGVILLLYIV